MCRLTAALTAFAVLAGSISGDCLAQTAESGDDLVGAWHGAMQFSTGAFAETKDLELMYAFAAGGTMTESSNYDASPPVPPAYGVWRRVGVRRYEAKYQFFQTRPVTSADELVKGGGWAPNGYGVITQTFTLSEDGMTFESTATVELFDKQGKPMAGGGEATARGARIGFTSAGVSR
jgi:hypothetical protein